MTALLNDKNWSALRLWNYGEGVHRGKPYRRGRV